VAANNIVDFPGFQVGDQRPVSLRIKPNLQVYVASATYAVYNTDTNQLIASGTCQVKNDKTCWKHVIDTPTVLEWDMPGNFICWFEIFWSNGIVDNTVAARITVSPQLT
jgi:hypothetical protein